METPKFTLAKRTAALAKDVRILVKQIPRTISSMEDMKQLVRSSGSVAANYIEADEAVSRDDFLYRLRLCKKESKESILWLDLLAVPENLLPETKRLTQECMELVRIFQAIITKMTK